MVNRHIVWVAARGAILQPPLLLLIVVQTAVIVVLIVGVQLEYGEHSLISVRFFGRELSEGDTFLRLLLPMLTGFLTSAVMFLLIIGTSSLIPEMLSDPLVSIILTRPISRIGLFTSTVAGMLIAVLTDIITFALILITVLTLKGSSMPILAPLLGSLSFAIEFLVVASCCSLCGMLTESASATAILGLVLYFGLGQMVATVDQSGNVFLKVIAYAIPHTGSHSAGTQQLVLGALNVLPPLTGSLIRACVYFATAAFLFHRRDL